MTTATLDEDLPFPFADWIDHDYFTGEASPDEAEVAEKTSVYRFYDADGRLLYVGITKRRQRRISEHAASKTWWHEVASATFEHHPTRSAAALAEATAIQHEDPVHNIMRPPIVAADLEPESAPKYRGIRGVRTPEVEQGLRMPARMVLPLFERQARTNFGMTPGEFIAAWEAGDIPRDDPKLATVLNLMPLVRVPVGEGIL